jgi:predicted RNA-binding protein (virulence factor B family)
MDNLQQQGGFIPVTDKSRPKVIADLFGVSKKTFKKTIGSLYKKRLINLEKDGIRLREGEEKGTEEKKVRKVRRKYVHIKSA